MDLYSTHSDPRNADFLDSRGFPIYRISTNSGFVSSGTSTISRFVAGPGGAPQAVIIATIEWHSFKSAIFRLRGLTLKESQYIHSSGVWTRKRTFNAPSGRSYTWNSQAVRHHSFARPVPF
ncbi:hypothetical protein K488DRAFT_51542 [Vararia minispora EC-137]|uniref:Uncharacterized protein n=1 Tax=Vararia minispora EC-137 TaxID=1314806 RepID=A0ACB8QIM9_9AGAM|nr:hypothetical protein K488DRAFT_51542 [Vararia minispora EC-137]